MKLLEGLRVVSLALNLPGPAACARLLALGAAVDKVEPPAGDPFETYHPGWYARLHAGLAVHRLDAKDVAGRARLDALLGRADVLVTAQRPAALARLGLDAASLAPRFPRLCLLQITGHVAPHAEVAGHDLTYQALHGLVEPGRLPATLFADMAGAERAVATALALVHARDRTGRGEVAAVPLEEAAAWLAQPLAEGLTGPGAMLGGALPAYGTYAARDGWIAVAALEPHFAARLAQALDLATLTHEGLARRFATETASHWEAWARERDVPLVALRPPPALLPKDTH